MDVVSRTRPKVNSFLPLPALTRSSQWCNQPKPDTRAFPGHIATCSEPTFMKTQVHVAIAIAYRHYYTLLLTATYFLMAMLVYLLIM